jgi:hypothetical protein
MLSMRRTVVMLATMAALVGCRRAEATEPEPSISGRDVSLVLADCSDSPYDESCIPQSPPCGTNCGPTPTEAMCSDLLGPAGSIGVGGFTVEGAPDLSTCSGQALYRVESSGNGLSLSPSAVHWYVQDCHDGPYGEFCIGTGPESSQYAGTGLSIHLDVPNRALGYGRRTVFAMAQLNGVILRSNTYSSVTKDAFAATQSGSCAVRTRAAGSTIRERFEVSGSPLHYTWGPVFGVAFDYNACTQSRYNFVYFPR